MKYKIDIKGIHCTGCLNLIKMYLEDIELKDVNIDQDTNTGSFVSFKSKAEVEKLLDSIFKELKEYEYSNLNVLK